MDVICGYFFTMMPVIAVAICGIAAIGERISNK